MTHDEKSGLLGPSVAAAIVLLILLGLGTWQLERKALKDRLLAQIAARVTAEPMVLDAAATLFRSGEDLEYSPVRARGRYLNHRTLFYYAPGKEGPGWHAYTPLETPAGGTLLVNRGFLPDAAREAWLKSQPERTPEADVVGLLRRPGAKGWFSPANDAARNIWYWRDLDGMAISALKSQGKIIAPFFIEMIAGRPPGAGQDALPRPGVTRLELPNRHLEYAVTWYGLAATLIGVYLVFVQGRLKSRRHAP